MMTMEEEGHTKRLDEEGESDTHSHRSTKLARC